MLNDPAIVTRVLDLLRQYGWEAGAKHLQEEVDHTPDSDKKELLRFFTGWNAAERGQFEEAKRWFKDCEQTPTLTAWALVGQAFVALRASGKDNYQAAEQFLRQAEKQAATPDDPALQATIAHLRGSLAYHQNDSTPALDELTKAWQLFGKDHFGSGRVLDTFGMVYADKDNFHAAEMFYRRALECKQRHGDQMGLALTNGNLGRLYLQWEYLDKAAQCFADDLKIAEATLDERGQALMYNHLGQVALAQGEDSAAVNNLPAAQKHWANAADYFDDSIRRADARQWKVHAGFSYKDRARLHLLRNQIEEAAADAKEAQERFQELNFVEGLAHVQRVWGVIRREQKDIEEALRQLRSACEHFKHSEERVEQARTEWEIARTLRASTEPRPRVTMAYLEALASAEACRRSRLVERIERELGEVDPVAQAAHLYQRVRGRSVKEPTTSLVNGIAASVSVLYLDVMDSTQYGKEHDPAEVMVTLNQMMADFVGVLRQHQGTVSSFRGDGFLAIFRDERHAERAVAAGLDLCRALQDFNQPRAVLELKPFVARIGIATGAVCLANMGTYDKMDFTAVGTPANRGARVEGVAKPNMPCIDRQTREEVGERFGYRTPMGRRVKLKGLGWEHVWDVVSRAEPAGRLPSKEV